MEFKELHYLVAEREQFYHTRYTEQDWTLYIVRSGSFRYTFAGKSEVLSPGDVYIVPPEVCFERSVISPICVDFIRFLPHVSQELPFPIPKGRFVPRDTARLQGTLKLMRALSHTEENAPSPALSHLLTDLLLQLTLESRPALSDEGGGDRTVSDILHFFEENYSTKINLKDLAARHALSPSGLIFKFKRATGLQPMRHLIRIRVRHAKDLLTTTARPIAEIASLVGFDNCYYFSNAFKKQTGLSPSEYRKTYTI